MIQKKENIKVHIDIKQKTGELENFVPKIGMVVERHLIDGDIVLFNRQPSLHKMSMMGHRVRVLPGNTFRLQLAVVYHIMLILMVMRMNLHVPQSIQASMEIEHYVVFHIELTVLKEINRVLV